jgi:hypothetical protein
MHRKNMKKKSKETKDELKPEYDFSQMQIIKRGEDRKQPKKLRSRSRPT